MKRCVNTREWIKKSIKFFLTILIISIPFIHSTQILGVNTFLDSFEKSSEYILVENNEEYLVIQKTKNQNCIIDKNDKILYFDEKGELAFNQVKNIHAIGNIKRYYTYNEKYNNMPIYESQILGKVIKEIDNNILNFISVNFWDIAIHNLNINYLFVD